MTLLHGIGALWFGFAMAALWRLVLVYLGVSASVALGLAVVVFVVATIGGVALARMFAQARRHAQQSSL